MPNFYIFKLNLLKYFLYNSKAAKTVLFCRANTIINNKYAKQSLHVFNYSFSEAGLGIGNFTAGIASYKLHTGVNNVKTPRGQ